MKGCGSWFSHNKTVESKLTAGRDSILINIIHNSIITVLVVAWFWIHEACRMNIIVRVYCPSSYYDCIVKSKGFPVILDSNESTYNAENWVWIPGSGKSPREGNGYPRQYSPLENSTNRGAWWAIVHEVAKSQTWLSDYHTSPQMLSCILGHISKADFPLNTSIKVIHAKFPRFLNQPLFSTF